ncbi:hypothetical protein SAMN00120144_3470 [Hymenobacter roseosalivarius DSM 11622]|uniref:Uncharacterized protein n=1 Tax=Hymenobacter roseosalivarius DSM 11622 TaxID=645990 RepID=A0A1W1V5P6_9BACT|nr:hypothetical protein [Hymenobacter roseosalivarius]SMB88757.1 hypothetical protein SAMN00120144_3470 [Hymenobacter roseosalivarius DSM 11622]
MSTYCHGLPARAFWLGSLVFLAGACTATQEQAAEVDRAPLPTQIRTDADRQAAYNSGTRSGAAIPDATPGRVRLGEQAARSNSRQRIENVNTNDPNTSTPETRLRRLRGAPADTIRRPAF